MKRIPTKLAKRIEVLEQQKKRKAVPSGLTEFYVACERFRSDPQAVIPGLAHFYGESDSTM